MQTTRWPLTTNVPISRPPAADFTPRNPEASGARPSSLTSARAAGGPATANPTPIAADTPAARTDFTFSTIITPPTQEATAQTPAWPQHDDDPTHQNHAPASHHGSGGSGDLGEPQNPPGTDQSPQTHPAPAYAMSTAETPTHEQAHRHTHHNASSSHSPLHRDQTPALRSCLSTCHPSDSANAGTA